MKAKIYKELHNRKAFIKTELNRKIYRFLLVKLGCTPGYLSRKRTRIKKDRASLFRKGKRIKKYQKFRYKKFFIKRQLNKILKTMKKASSKVRLSNRCVLTGRNRGILRPYNVSRVKMRELLQFGIFPGHKKAVW